MNFKSIGKVALACGLFAGAAAVYAGVGGTTPGGSEFDDIWTLIQGWSQGVLGRIIALGALIVGIAFGLVRQSVVAAVIGCLFLGRYFDQIMNEPIRQQQTLQENLAREVSYDFPLLSSLMPLSDEEIMTALTDAGYTLYERTPVGTDPDGGFEVIKLPADVSLEEAGLMYVQGIDKLSAGDAVKLLKGAWTLTVSRKAGDDMRLRYADFASGTIEKAVQGAMQVEGLENAEVTDSGVDDSGNTYQAGVVSTDNGTYNWRVSVIELDEVYDISGLPNTAFYVGIRFTAQA